MYPAGALAAGIPSGMLAARVGVKPTVLVGLSLLALTTVAFGFADSVWALDLARFLQGVSSAFSWTGALAWLVAAAPAGRRGRLIGSAFGAAIAGAMFGPVLGAVASFTGTRPAFGAVAGVACSSAPARRRRRAVTPETPQPIRMLFEAISTGPAIQTGVWLCLLPALCFGTLSVLAPLQTLRSRLGRGRRRRDLSRLGRPRGRLVAGARPDLRPAGSHAAVLGALAASAVVALLLPWPRNALAAGIRRRRRRLRVRQLLDAGDVARDGCGGDARAGLRLRLRTRQLAWAPGQAGGAALGGAVASATSDAVPYLGLTTICLLTLAALTRYGATAAPVSAER